MTRKLILSTALSILIFFSISFLTVLFQINSPWNRIYDYYELNIGFPFVYYREFMLDPPIPNSGWIGENLLLDCDLTWVFTVGVYFFVKGEKEN